MSSDDRERKKELERRLSLLIGEDGASDFLEHALSCDDTADLKEFMCGLLGRAGDDVTTFCADVDRFRNGQPLSRSSSSNRDETTTTTTTTSTKNEPRTRAPLDYSGVARKKTTKQQRRGPSGRGGGGKRVDKRAQLRAAGRNNNNKNNNNTTNNNNNNNNTNPTKPPPPKHDAPTAAASKPPPPSAVVAVDAPPRKSAPVAPPPPPPVEPLARGKAAVDCGCFGTVHDPLTNCLNCGRILCAREGYGFCPSCGYAVEPPPSGGAASTAAERHKERLLRFDRQFAQRTKVYDDQADWFANSRSEWLTEEERATAGEEEDRRRRTLHERKKPVLSIAL